MLTKINVAFNGFDAYDVEPTKVPDLFASRPVVVFGKWRGSATGAIELTGTTGRSPYRTTIGAFAEVVRGASGHEATDPRRVAQVVRDLAGRDDAPVRLLLGADAVAMAQQAARELAAHDEAWRDVSLSVADGTAPTPTADVPTSPGG